MLQLDKLVQGDFLFFFHCFLWPTFLFFSALVLDRLTVVARTEFALVKTATKERIADLPRVTGKLIRSGKMWCLSCIVLTISHSNIHQVVEGQVDRFAWNYYSFNLESENTIVVRVNERRVPGSGTMDCDLFVRRGFRPVSVWWMICVVHAVFRK